MKSIRMCNEACFRYFPDVRFTVKHLRFLPKTCSDSKSDQLVIKRCLTVVMISSCAFALGLVSEFALLIRLVLVSPCICQTIFKRSFHPIIYTPLSFLSFSPLQTRLQTRLVLLRHQSKDGCKGRKPDADNTKKCHRCTVWT